MTSDLYVAFGDLVVVDTTGGAVQVFLPSAVMLGEVAVRLAAGASAVTIVPAGSDTVDGGASASMTLAGESRILASDGAGAWSTAAAGPSAASLTGLAGDVVDATVPGMVANIIASTVPGMLDSYRPMPLVVNTQLSVSGAYTIPDLDVAQMHDLTLTGNVTLTLPGNTQGKEFRIVLRQDSVGGRTVTWAPNVYKPAGAFNLSVTPDTSDSVFAFSVCVDKWAIFLEGKDFC